MADEYLGFAPCAVKAGFFDVDDARAHKRNLKEWQAARKAELAAHRRLTAADVADALAQVPAIAPDHPVATVIRPLFEAPRTPVPAPMRPEEVVAQAAIIADLDTRRAARAPRDDDSRAIFARARDLERRVASGEAITKDQAIWLEGYRNTSEYRTWAAMVADFGESVLNQGA
jgi:hypothetical protein